MRSKINILTIVNVSGSVFKIRVCEEFAQLTSVVTVWHEELPSCRATLLHVSNHASAHVAERHCVVCKRRTRIRCLRGSSSSCSVISWDTHYPGNLTMAPKQRMRIANEKATKNITLRGNVPKSSVSRSFWIPKSMWILFRRQFSRCTFRFIH